MNVSKTITRLEKSSVRLSLTIPKEEAQVQYQELIKDYAQKVQIPGFRKGKAPQEVLLRKFGDALKGDALSKIVEKAVGEVFQDESLARDERPLPYAYPRMEEEPKLDFDQDLNFSLVYDVLPKVNVGQWKGLTAEVPQAELGEEDIARELEELRERNSIVLDKDEAAAAQNGDVATLNYFEAGEDGAELPNSRRDDFAFTLGSKLNAYQIDDDIIGMKKGETKEVVKTYPPDEAGTEPTLFSGRTIKLNITLTALKEKKLPDLDDELAQDVDEKFTTLDDLKHSIRERLEKNLQFKMREVKISKILEKIMENTPVTLPESMVRVELDGRLRNLARQFGTDTDKLMQMLAQNGEGLDDIEGRWRPSAEKALHSRLIVETIMDEQHIEAADEEIEPEMERIAAESGTSLEDVQKYYAEEQGRAYLKDSIRERKIFDLLLAENTVKTGKKTNYLDFMSKND